MKENHEECFMKKIIKIDDCKKECSKKIATNFSQQKQFTKEEFLKILDQKVKELYEYHPGRSVTVISSKRVIRSDGGGGGLFMY